MLRRTLLGVVLALAGAAAWAQPDCTPTTELSPEGPGGPIVTHWSTLGYAASWWCPSATQPNAWYRRTLAATWEEFTATVRPAMGRILAAADREAQARTEVAAATMARKPAPGTQAECDLNKLLRDACVAFYAASRPPFPSGLSEAAIAEPGRCGPVPVCTPPAPAPEQWRTPLAGTLRLYTASGGRLVAVVQGRTAPAGAACDCSLAKVLSGTSTLCALSGGPATEVTTCQRR